MNGKTAVRANGNLNLKFYVLLRKWDLRSSIKSVSNGGQEELKLLIFSQIGADTLIG